MNGASLGRSDAVGGPDTLRYMSGRTDMSAFRALFGVALVASLVVLSAAPAAGHGDITSSRPEAGARLNRAPQQVRLVLAEPPAQGSDVTVVDPCGDEVSGEPQRDGETISVSVDGGRPGRWRVQLRSISSVDGHVISDRFAFRVAGKRDCSPDENAAGPDDNADEEADDEISSRPPIENDDPGSGFPVVPFALGTVVVVGIAVALRGKKS